MTDLEHRADIEAENSRMELLDQRTYTETEMLAIRAAALREAAEKMLWVEDQEIILALIDQPAKDALNALIGAAYEAAAKAVNQRGIEEQEDEGGGLPRSVQNFYRARDVVRDRTPADALAALEQVKQAERERAEKWKTLAMFFANNAPNEVIGWLAENDDLRAEFDAAIRGESDE